MMEEVTWAGRRVCRVFWKQWDLTVGLGLWVNSGEVRLSLVHGDEGSASELHPGNLSWTFRLRNAVDP